MYKGHLNIRDVSTEHYTGIQVVVAKDKEEKTKAFSIARSPNKVLKEALQCRDQFRQELGLPPISRRNGKDVLPPFRRSAAPKSNTGHMGVHYQIRTRGNTGRRDVAQYQVVWKDIWVSGKKWRCRNFYIGPIEDRDPAMKAEALRIAVGFRTEYERCVVSGLKFEPSRFNGWRKRFIANNPLELPNSPF
jgi:hypothetical protein